MPALRASSHAERGASAVEFALLAPLFFMLVFGGISSALAFDRNNTLTHAARDAARIGATLPAVGSTQIPDQWFVEIATAAKGAANGHLDSTIPGRYVCVAYIGFGPTGTSSSDWTRRRVESGASVTYSNGSLTSPSTWCFDDGRGSNGAERRVQVQVGRDTDFNVILWGQTIGLRSGGVARFEAVR